MSLFDRTPRLRWVVPAGAALLVVGSGAIGALSASADPGLPPRTAEELLMALQQPTATALSGTVVSQADLGLPELPMASSRGSELSSLASGTRTLRVWTDGPDRMRLAVLGASSESDMVRNGDEVWVWSSDRGTADRYVLAKPDSAEMPDELPPGLPRTPEEAAELALDALDPTTRVTTAGAGTVAGRAAYELLLTPTQAGTLVARVAIAIDAETSVPLRVQVYSTELADPALEVGFSSVDFGRPDSEVFDFTPPPGATVTDHGAVVPGAGSHDGTAQPHGGLADEATVVGSGWISVVIAPVPAEAIGALVGADSQDSAAAGQDAMALLESLPRASGSWGSGWVLGGTLFSAVLTNDGTMAVGMVAPESLYAALAQR